MNTAYEDIAVRQFNPRAALINGNGDADLSENALLGDPSKLGSPPKTYTSDGQKTVDTATIDAMQQDKDQFVYEKMIQNEAARAQRLLGNLAKMYQPAQGGY